MFATAASTRTWIDGLNPEQRAAVTSDGGHVLVVAGAGTGKTATLAGRVAWLVEQGVPVERILLLTFTRRAARELLTRARSLTRRSGRDAARVLGGTFHSVAHRFVRLHASTLGLAAEFGVLDGSDAGDLLDLVRREAGHAASVRRFPRKTTLLDIYSRTVNAQRPLSEVVAEGFPWCAEHRKAMAEIFRLYGERKARLGLLDLDDLLLCWRALALDPVVGPAMAGAFDHVLVDEYQDVNGLQVDVVRALGSGGSRVTAVGDDFQAIYGFRSASARHILDFPNQFEGTEMVTLERNYRSSQPILDVANALAAQAQRAYRKELWSERNTASRPVLVFTRDETEQAVDVCDRVLDARERGMLLRHQAVLMRTTHDSDLLELELTRRDVPFVKYGGLRYVEAAHVKDFVALLRLADNAADELSWFRILQLLEGVGPATAGDVVDALGVREGGWAGTFERWPVAADRVPTPSRADANRLVDTLVRVADDPRAGPRAEQLRDALAPLLRARYPDADVRLQDLDALVGAAGEASDLGKFVSELILDPPASSADLAGPPLLDEDYLVLSTVHSAKGLEWDAVHVLAVYDGNFPACMSAGSAEAIEEERRLLYVALTRARRELTIHVPLRYYHRPRGGDDAHGYGKASRFLDESVQTLCQVVRPPEPAGQLPPSAVPPGRKVTVSVSDLFA